MKKYETCTCETCYGSDDPCRSYFKKDSPTTCREQRASADWCELCQSEWPQEWQDLQNDEKEAENEALFDIRVAQGCI